MSWTDPTTHVYATGEIVTAATMNTFIQADLAFLYGDSTWTAPSFTNGWVNYGGTLLTVGFRRIGTRIFLKGTMKSGTMSAAAFTLPTGYRPLADCEFAVNSNLVFGEVEIKSAGTVTALTGSNAGVSLDTISFDTV